MNSQLRKHITCKWFSKHKNNNNTYLDTSVLKYATFPCKCSLVYELCV